jgi:phage replication O-like protein O
MASPQCEDGYTKIANELLEALYKITLGGSEAQVLFAIIRKTYGFQKKMDTISVSQLEEMTCISRRMVIYTIQNLEAKNMITVNRKRGRGVKNEINEISIQKKYNEWVVQGKSIQYKNTLEKQRLAYQKSKEIVVQGIEGSARNGSLVVQGNTKKGQFLAPTKERKKTKENIYSDFFEVLWKLYPNKDGKKESLKHFNATVKTENDKMKIDFALANYLEDLKDNSWKKAKNGSTWFNNWQDWIPENIDELIAEEQQVV